MQHYESDNNGTKDGQNTGLLRKHCEKVINYGSDMFAYT
jgi:hypothetical protein